MRDNLRLALRLFRRSPAFTAVAVLSLALGIGANTTIFSLLDQALLRSLPASDPSSLVVFHDEGPIPGHRSSDDNETVFSCAMYRDLAQSVRPLAGIAARSSTEVSVSSSGATSFATAEIVSGNYFDVLGLRPALGRLLAPSDDAAPGAGNVLVLTHAFWVTRFGADPSVSGRVIRVNNHPFTIAGVLPPPFRGFTSGNPADVFVPISMKDVLDPGLPDVFHNRRYQWLNLFARLAPATPPARAEAELLARYRPLLASEAASAHWDPPYRARFLARRIQLLPASQGINELKQTWSRPLAVLAFLVGLVLLIACANVANLLIARAAGRRREIAIRVAVGASRSALARQFLAESVLLSLAGGAAGLLLAWWTLPLLLHLLPDGSGSALSSSVIDPRVLLFTSALALFTGLLFGLAPALSAARPDPSTVLKDQAASLASAFGAGLLRRALVAGQVALSLLLLAASGLFLKSFSNLLHHSPGFHPESAVTFTLRPALNGYSRPQTDAFVSSLISSVSSLNGVSSASAATEALFSGEDRSANVSVEGYRSRPDEDNDVGVNGVMPAFFSTLGIPMLAGRDFTPADGASAPKVAIVNRAFLRRFSPGESLLLRHMAFGAGPSVKLDIQIVGVASDFQYDGLREKVNPFVYLPYAQDPVPNRSATFYLRAPAGIAPALRSLVHRADPNLPIDSIQPMTVLVANSASTDRLVAALSAAFALLATLLAAVGLYGVIAFSVARRTAEIGLRLALGASRAQVLWLVLREVLVLAASGLALGLPATLLLGRAVETQLYGLNAHDPLILASACAVLLLAALLAGFLPARRASLVDPILALRYE